MADVPALAVAAGGSAAPTVWPLGDSITYGLSGQAGAKGTGVEGVTPGGYRGMLDSMLGQDHVAHQFIGTWTANPTPVLTSEGESTHDGHPGYRIDQIAADLEGVAGGPSDNGGDWMTRAVDPIHPDVVILLLGGNDILQQYDPSARYPTSSGLCDYSDSGQVATFVADMTARLQSLIGEVETIRPGTEVVLSDTTPIGTGKVDPVTGAYASAVASLARQEIGSGVHLVFTNIWSQFVESTPGGEVVTPGLIGQDGIHPTAGGYDVIAQSFRTELESLI
jgi:lysophospholipase L1-like esterase